MTRSSAADTQRLSEEGAEDVATVAKGGVVQITGQIASRGLLFVFVAVAVRTLGAAGFGLYRQVFQILNVLSLVAPGGFQFSAVRFIARARAIKDHGAVRGSARVSIAGAAIFSALLAIGVFAGAERIASAFADSSASRAEVAELLRLGAAYVPLFGVMQVLRSCTQAYKTMVPSAMVGQVILPVGRLGLGIAALLAGFAVAGAVVSLVMSAGIAMLAAIWFYMRILTPLERQARPRIEIAPLVKFALPQAGVSLFSVQSLGLGVLLLGVLKGDRDVGLFAVALSLQGAGGVFLTGVLQIWAPMVVDLYERGEISRLESLYQTINRWVVTFALPVFAVLIFMPEPFVRLLAGKQGMAAAGIVTVLAVGNLFFVGTGPCSHLISMTGRAGLNFVNSIVAVVLYVALGLLVVPRHGALGMAAVDAGVTALSNSVRVVQGKLLVGVQPFGRSFLKPVGATLCAAGVLVAWMLAFPHTIVMQLAGIAVATLAYLLVLRALGMDAEERYVLERLRSRVFGKRCPKA